MKLSKIAFRLVSLSMILVLIVGVSGLSAFAAGESDYVAEFRIETDKLSYNKDEFVQVDVKLKMNYYIYAMEVPVIYDGNALEVQNTSSTSNKSFLTFKGSLASAYNTNGNWKSPADFYNNRNSNKQYWSQQSVKDRYKIAFASWAADTTLNDGYAVMLSEEETIVSFVLKAKKGIKDISELIFLCEDFKKTTSFVGGRWFCARSKTEIISTASYVTTGQTIIYNGVDPTKKEPEVYFTAEEGTTTIIDKDRGFIYGLEEGLYDLEDFVEYEGGTLEYIESSNGFGTGTIINFIVDGKTHESYTIIVFGDLTGDGVIDTYDTVLLAAIVNFDMEFEDDSATAVAADIAYNDDFADTYDLAYLYQVVSGDSVIDQTMDI